MFVVSNLLSKVMSQPFILTHKLMNRLLHASSFIFPASCFLVKLIADLISVIQFHFELHLLLLSFHFIFVLRVYLVSLPVLLLLQLLFQKVVSVTFLLILALQFF